MKKLIFLLFLGCTQIAWAQESHPKTARSNKFPLVVSVNFNAVSTPFHKPGNNLKNLGLRVGTELPYNKKGNLFQTVNVGYYRNRLNGDGIYLNSEFGYRPNLYKGFGPEFKLGPGFANIYLPTKPLETDGKGNWKQATNTGKTAFQVHGSLGLQYHNLTRSQVDVSPFVQYEIVGVAGYNKTIPLLPTSFIHAGCRLKF
ncbi:hypothetical protein HUW51_23370 [Adhaeribacter swui]|uniref:DUF3575 domain-containing protein n=1 Tax=Adhaeribacter swui TaxID=2086471 RepID=A0A7G7GEC0_9BACT|nr:hypothetical protein [Adhaeribacter swui]QNF35504.1 hypothetical protein HUW51_23370 [Adhaeribacter swui]